MTKKNVLTAAGIILSIAIAIGGLAMTNRLIGMESDRLLSGTTSFSIDIPVIEPMHVAEEDNDYPHARPSLTENEMVSILRNWETSPWENTVRRRLHEPTAGQIDMEQAIRTGRAGLMFLYDNGILLSEAMGFSDTRAYLGQNILPNEEFLPQEYSYWNVTFSNDHVDVFMTINAVTGQIWKVEINARRAIADEFASRISMDVGNNEIINALAAFMYDLGLAFDNEAVYGQFAETQNPDFITEPSPSIWPLRAYIERDAYVMSAFPLYGLPLVGHRFADGRAAAIIAANGILTSDGRLYFTRFNISLTSRVP